jgi:DNA-binding response OmpR family regulator
MTATNKNIRKILIVEDEEEFAHNLAFYLSRIPGAKVSVTHSGEDAVLEAARFAPDCVVTDYNLPGIDGLETASQIRARDPDTFFVLITGHFSDAVITAAREQGMRHILVKPFRLADLAGCLRA